MSATALPLNSPALLPLAASIGSPAIAGSTALAKGVYTLRGAGTDIYGTHDQFEYAYADITGDTTLTARVTSVQNTHTWAKAGVMIRAGTGANGMFADVVVTPSGIIAFQWRSATGGPAATAIVSGTHFTPQWVKLIRKGNVFTAFHSADGLAWQQIGSALNLAIPANATAGLAVTSVNPAKPCTATLDNVSLS